MSGTSFGFYEQLDNAINEGIIRDIEFVIQHKRFRAALILTYAGIDAMSYLALPNNREEVTKKDFIKWADNYMQICRNGHVTGLKLYAARCGLLHTYTVESRITRTKAARKIVHAIGGSLAVGTGCGYYRDFGPG